MSNLVSLRFPLGPDYTFVRAPEGVTVPSSVNESKVLFKIA